MSQVFGVVNIYNTTKEIIVQGLGYEELKVWIASFVGGLKVNYSIWCSINQASSGFNNVSSIELRHILAKEIGTNYLK